MTQEEKQLLLKDLCARFPYGVALCAFYKTDEGWKEGNTCFLGMRVDEGYIELYLDNGWIAYLDDVKPYLRPMSSMTEEEKKELKSATCPEGTGYFDEQYLICPMSHFGEYISYDFMSDILNWLNAHHFDYRGLIEKGLALEAPKDMYKTE